MIHILPWFRLLTHTNNTKRKIVHHHNPPLCRDYNKPTYFLNKFIMQLIDLISIGRWPITCGNLESLTSIGRWPIKCGDLESSLIWCLIYYHILINSWTMIPHCGTKTYHFHDLITILTLFINIITCIQYLIYNL